MNRWVLAAVLWMAGIVAAEEATTPSASVPPIAQSLLMTQGAVHVLADDITGDGRLDLIFTSHNNNEIQVYQ